MRTPACGNPLPCKGSSCYTWRWRLSNKQFDQALLRGNDWQVIWGQAYLHRLQGKKGSYKRNKFMFDGPHIMSNGRVTNRYRLIGGGRLSPKSSRVSIDLQRPIGNSVDKRAGRSSRRFIIDDNFISSSQKHGLQRILTFVCLLCYDMSLISVCMLKPLSPLLM